MPKCVLSDNTSFSRALTLSAIRWSREYHRESHWMCLLLPPLLLLLLPSFVILHLISFRFAIAWILKRKKSFSIFLMVYRCIFWFSVFFYFSFSALDSSETELIVLNFSADVIQRNSSKYPSFASVRARVRVLILGALPSYPSNVHSAIQLRTTDQKVYKKFSNIKRKRKKTHTHKNK